MATIAENLSRIQSAKTDIRTAIEAKGVTVPSSATIDTYGTYVSQISGGMPMPSKLSSASFNDYGVITSAEIKSGVTSIGVGDNGFSGCLELLSVTISDSVITIGAYAFGNCYKLNNINIPSGVTSIGDYAFTSCYGISSITIPNSVTSIGYGAFESCSNLTGLTVNAIVPPTLGSGAFDDTNNCPIYVPASSLNAYQSAWSDYASRIQAIPGSYKWIATYSGGTITTAACDSTSAITMGEINDADLVSVEIGECVTSIGYGAFDDYSRIESCTIGSGVTSIAGTAFRDCRKLTSIDIPDSVTSIGGSAFNGCDGLTSCTIGSGITSIGIGGFSNCTSLTSITIKATTPPTLSSGGFYGSTCPIYVPAASLTAYQSADGWEDYRTRLQAIS